MKRKSLTAAEIGVMEAALPTGLTDDTRDLALCLFEGLALQDERAGHPVPQPGWAEQLGAWARQVLGQLQHLAAEKGGMTIYLAKGIAVHLSARDREMCAKFRGDYRVLAREYGLTEMRVRQIVDTWQRERYLARQQGLDGI